MTATPKTGANVKNITHEIVLSDKMGNKFGFKLADGEKSLVEDNTSPSSLATTTGGGRYSDYDPTFSHFEQIDWSGGRGNEFNSDDDTGFHDSQMAWTLTNRKLHNGLQWKMATGTRSMDKFLPGSVSWRMLFGSETYIEQSFVASASYNANEGLIWLRRRGNPGTLTYEICADSGGSPSTVLVTATVTTTSVTDTISVFQVFDWSGTQALVAGTTYHFKVYSSGTDAKTSHWEIAVDSATASAKYSAAGSSWTAATYKVYGLVLDTDIDRQLFPFRLDGCDYAVTRNADGSASKLYINGRRGLATSATSSSVTDTGNSFGTDSRYVGARIKIFAGKGVGQDRLISSHTNTAITSTPDWKVTPDNTSRYVIYNTPYWNELTGHGLGEVVSKPCVAGNVAYFPQGGSVNIRRMRHTATVPDYADLGTDKADMLYLFYSTTSKVAQIIRLLNSDSTIAKATAPAWGASASWSTAVAVGSTDYQFTNIIDFNSSLYIFKEDSIWIDNETTVSKMNLSMYTSPSENNGKAIATVDLLMYFTFMHSIEGMNGANITDFGLWRGTGLSNTTRGPISSICPVMSWLFASVDGGSTGYSSIFCWDGSGWHNTFVAPVAGWRIRNIWWQPNINGNNKLLCDCGGNIIYIDFPKETLNPLNDTEATYQHESVVISSTFDFNKTQLNKFFKELAVTTNKMTSSQYIEVDIQTDDDIDTDNWTYKGTAYNVTNSIVPLDEGAKKMIRYRLRMNTESATFPPIILCTILKGYMRDPVKSLWNITIQASSIQLDRRGRRDLPIDDLYDWLKEANQDTRGIWMRSTYPQMDQMWVVVEPASWYREWHNTSNKQWGGKAVLTIREL